MATLFIYLIKSSGLIAMFYLAYYFLLRKETFFNSNRWYLLSGLIISALLPLVVFTKIIWIEPTTSNLGWSKIPMTTTMPIENEGFEINGYLVFAIVYAIGILFFLVKFAFDFYSLSKVLKGKNIQKQADFKFIDVRENIAPFSYFNSIVYNSSLYSATELENILEHEKVHSAQNHTADVLFSRLFCILFWLNPLVWLYKKAIVQNLEFIADSEASKKISDTKAYQMTLLKITTHENCVAITNHFYQSLIKKRIVMLNKNQSKKWNSWKYVTVIPALIAFVLLFQIEVIAQVKPEKNLATDTTIHVDKSKLISNKKSNQDNNTIKLKGYGDFNQNTYEFYIDEKKVSKSEFENFDYSKIESIDVKKGKTNTISIKTKTIAQLDDKIVIKGISGQDGTKPLIIVDGNQAVSNFIIEDIPIDQIENINVLKDKSAIEKYGSDGKNGVIEIITKENNAKNKNESQQVKVVGYGTNQEKVVNGWKVSAKPQKEGIKQDVANNHNIDYKKVVIIIDGEISNEKKLNKLDPKEIASINVQKFTDASQKIKDEKVKQYGKKALNGIIEVETEALFK